MTNMSLEDFVRKYDLYDRSLDKVEKIKGRIIFTFSMFHCDDHQRNEIGKEYILKAEFSESDINVIKGNIIQYNENVSGEILKFNMDGNALKFGVNWRDYQKNEDNWSEFVIFKGPLSLREYVFKI